MAGRDLSDGIAADELAEGNLVQGMLGDEAIVLVRHQGRVCALAGTCTHLQAPLGDGIAVDGEIRCPWHHARFSVETGEAVGAPAFQPLARYAVEEDGGMVRIGAKCASRPATEDVPDVGRVVIVGGGAAGHACADILARAGAGGQVTLLSADEDPPYDRTFCSKQYLAGKAERNETMLPSPGLGREPAVTVRPATKVAQLDLAKKMVELDGGERIGFDTLVLAMGAEPVIPDFTGSDRDDVHVLRTLADADALIDAAGDAKQAVVLGASYIGLEVAASLTQRGLAVTVIGEEEAPLAGTAGVEVGRRIEALHRDKGVTFHMGRSLDTWDGSGAMLDDGTTVAGDLLVLGTGVKPRTHLAETAGIALADEDAGGGIAVDATLRTSADGVYAIGDVASVPDPRLGHPIRVEHWVVAQRQGQWLARHLLGRAAGGYDDLPFFWSGHYDTSLRYVGHVATPDDRRIDGDLEALDFAVTFRERDADHAMLTCGRDRLALETEATWEK